jgi:dienelactone hydrolase
MLFPWIRMDSKTFNQVRCSVLFLMIHDAQKQQPKDSGLIERLREQLPEELRRAKILTTEEVERGTDHGWIKSQTLSGPVPGWMFERARNAMVLSDYDWAMYNPVKTADTIPSLTAVFADGRPRAAATTPLPS